MIIFFGTKIIFLIDLSAIYFEVNSWFFIISFTWSIFKLEAKEILNRNLPLNETGYSIIDSSRYLLSKVGYFSYDIDFLLPRSDQSSSQMWGAKGDNKTHHFSKTLKEHNKAVKKYQRWII